MTFTIYCTVCKHWWNTESSSFSSLKDKVKFTTSCPFGHSFYLNASSSWILFEEPFSEEHLAFIQEKAEEHRMAPPSARNLKKTLADLLHTRGKIRKS